MRSEGYDVPDDLYYSKDHQWARIENKQAVIGIADYAQKALQEIVHAEPPTVGSEIKQMEPMGAVESVKSVSEIFAPISGERVEINTSLADSPELLNKYPYGKGWIAKVRSTNLKKNMKSLMTAQQYADYITKLKEK